MMPTVLNINDPTQNVKVHLKGVILLTLPKKVFPIPPNLSANKTRFVMIPSRRSGMVPSIIRIGVIQNMYEDGDSYKVVIDNINKYRTTSKVFKNNQPYNYIPYEEFEINQ